MSPITTLLAVPKFVCSGQPASIEGFVLVENSTLGRLRKPAESTLSTTK